MHREILQVHQIDSFTVAHQNEGELAIVKIREQDQVCALGLILEWALNLD